MTAMEGITVIHDQAMPDINNHQQTTYSPRQGPPKLNPLNLPPWERHPNPTAQLKVLRDPRNQLNFADDYLSPTQGKSDTYNRFLINQVRKHEICDCEDKCGSSEFPSTADSKCLDTHRFFESLGKSAGAFMEREGLWKGDLATLKKEVLMRECWEDADQRLEMALKYENLDFEKWMSISEELSKATQKHVEACSELLRAEEAHNGVLVQFGDENGDENESEPEGAATPFSIYLDNTEDSDTETDSDSNDDYEDKEETFHDPMEPAEFNNYPDVFDDSDSDSESNYNSDDEDDFSHFYNYKEEAESSTTVDITEVPDSPKTKSVDVLRSATPLALPPRESIVIDQPERTWTLDQYEAYLKRAIENYDETRERYSFKEARGNFLAIIQPRQQRQLERHPCNITVIPNRIPKQSVPDPEHLPLPTIRVTTPAGTQLKVEALLSPLPEDFDEYVRQRDAAQEGMQYDRELYFAGESSDVWEARMEKFNRLESMKKFHAFMSRENITYPNFATMEKQECPKQPAMIVTLSTITEDPQEEAAEKVEYARHILGVAQRRLDKALNEEDKFREVLIPATIRIRNNIKKEILQVAEQLWEVEERWGYLAKPPKTQDVVDRRTSETLKYMLINMLAKDEYHVDPKDSLRFISTTGETVTFVGRLREQQTWAYPLSLLPTAIDFAQQYKVFTPSMFGKYDTYEEVKLLAKEAKFENMRKKDWYRGLKDAANRAGDKDEAEYATLFKIVLNAFETMHKSFLPLPCEEREVPKEILREPMKKFLCESAKNKWDAIRKELDRKELEEAKREMELEERKKSLKPIKKRRSFGSIFGSKKKCPKKECPKKKTTVVVDSSTGK